MKRHDLSRISTIVGTLMALGYSAYYLYRFSSSLLWPSATKALLGLIVAFLFLVRKREVTSASSARITLLTSAHILCPLLFQFHLNSSSMTFLLGAGLVLAGGGLSGFALLDLWDRFGLLPGYRGICKSGLYSFVRHPIYLGYLLAALGSLLLMPSLANFVVTAIFAALTLLRIQAEEAYLLASSTDYLTYCGRVKCRIVPGVI